MSDENATPASPAPAGWYPDPQVPGQQRYWDGAAWTTSAPSSPAGAPGATGPTTSTKAIIGLVLAILSWPLCPIIAAIPALILAHSSDKEIESSQGRLNGEGLNTATRVVAWLNIAVYVVVGIVIGVLVVLGVIFSSPSTTSGLADEFRPDPTVNSRTGLPDGAYVMESPGVVSYLDDECMFGNVGDGVEGLMDKGIFVYGSGPVQCPDLVSVSAVYYEVVDGVATITRVE